MPGAFEEKWGSQILGTFKWKRLEERWIGFFENVVLPFN
jgi:hypothetical protein